MTTRPLLCLLLSIAISAAALADGLDDARRSLDDALSKKDESAARAAVAEVGKADSERAVKLLAAAAVAGREMDIYAALVDALAGLHAEPALKELLRGAASDPDWTVRFLFVDALARVDRPDARKALFAAFDDKHDGVASSAMRACREQKLLAAVRPLIDAFERFSKKDKGGKRAMEAGRALTGITGESFTSAGDWRRFWDANEAHFDPAGVAAKKAADGDRSTVLRRVDERGDKEYLDRLTKGDLVVVEGRSDECEAVLEALKLPFTLAPRAKAAETVRATPPTSVLIFNCNGDEESALEGQDAKALASFVERGGYLFTSDWGISEELAGAFPGVISAGPEQPEEAVGVRIGPARGQEQHPYLRDVFPDDPYARALMRWKIDDRAYAIVMTAKATGLVESDELGKRCGNPVVAATFRYGQGSVLHVMGHFKMQKDEKGDGFALQQLLVNFIVERQKLRGKKK